MEEFFPAGNLRIDLVIGEPCCPLGAPGGEDFGGERVGHAPGYEDHAAVLCPVRETALGDEKAVVGVEEFHGGK